MKRFFVLYLIIIVGTLYSNETPIILFSFYGWDDKVFPNEEIYKDIDAFINDELLFEKDQIKLKNIKLEGINGQYLKISNGKYTIFLPNNEINLSKDEDLKKYIILVSRSEDFQNQYKFKDNFIRFYACGDNLVFAPIKSYYIMSEFDGVFGIESSIDDIIVSFGLDSYKGKDEQVFNLGDVIGERNNMVTLHVNAKGKSISPVFVVLKNN